MLPLLSASDWKTSDIVVFGKIEQHIPGFFTAAEINIHVGVLHINHNVTQCPLIHFVSLNIKQYRQTDTDNLYHL